jgi:hypothetical protein
MSGPRIRGFPVQYPGEARHNERSVTSEAHHVTLLTLVTPPQNGLCVTSAVDLYDWVLLIFCVKELDERMC